MNAQTLIDKFNRQAKSYERKSRKKGFDWRWRKKLLQSANGKILELSVGAGKNFRLYPKNAQITAVDFSEKMLEIARKNAASYQLNADLVCASVEDLSFPANTFDTIVSTLSFCAYNDPVTILKKVQTWCKPDGQILLMEHGRSSYRLLSWVQDRMDRWQYRMVGCHPNRNMIEIFKASDLQIQKLERKFFTTVHLVWARPGL